MKHFDGKTSVSKKVSPKGDNTPIFSDQETREMIQTAIDQLDCGVIYWDESGRCELTNLRAIELMEINEYALNRGDRRSDLIEHIMDRGMITPDSLAKVDAALKAKTDFMIEYHTPSDTIIRVTSNRREAGGYVSTLTDLTEFRQLEAELTEERSRAEECNRKSSAELARLQAEKAEFESRQLELQRLSLVAAHAKDLIVISDQTNRIVWANEAYRRHNGLDLEMDLIGRSGRDVLAGPDSDPYKLAQIDEAIRNRQSATVELVCYRRSGEPYWMEQEIIPVFNEGGEHTNFIIVGRDISERRQAEAAADDARRFEEMKRAESKMMAEFNEWLQSSDTLDELFVVVSSFLGKLLPGSTGAVYTYGQPRDMLHRACWWGYEEPVQDFQPSACWALRRGRPYFYGDNTIDISCNHIMSGRHREPPERQYCLPIIAHGDTVGLLSIELDATVGTDTQKLVNFCAEHISLAIANVKMRDLLREQSTRDPLTGLYNRRYFLDYARREISRCIAQGKPATVISLDVDHFKKFNDTYGHEAGDEVLQALSGVLQKLFREADVPCRHGGEEFVVLMPGCGLERAEERAEQLRETVEALQLRHSGETLNITVSIGLAVMPEDGDNVPSLLGAADEALYMAKAAGRNQVKRRG